MAMHKAPRSVELSIAATLTLLKEKNTDFDKGKRVLLVDPSKFIDRLKTFDIKTVDSDVI